jgi:hypothetical protein
MDYYLEIKGSEAEPILIGTESFGWFYAEVGLTVLLNALNDDANIEQFQVRTDNGNVISIIDFVNHLEALKMRKHFT